MLAAWCIRSEYTGPLQGLSGFSGRTMPGACFIVSCFWLSVPVPNDSHETRYNRLLQDFSQNLLIWYPHQNKLIWNFSEIFGSSNLNSPENIDLQVLPRTWSTSPFSPVSLDLQQPKLGGRHIWEVHLPWKLVWKFSISLGMGVEACSVVPPLGQGQTQRS